MQPNVINDQSKRLDADSPEARDAMENAFPEKSKAHRIAMAYMFSEMFGIPDEFNSGHFSLLREYSEKFPQEICEFAWLSETDFLDAWRQDIRLLEDGNDPLILEESVYKPWTRQKNHPLSGKLGHCHGDPAAHMTAILKSFGLTLDQEHCLAPDSLSTLFEFLGFMLENQPQAEVVSFCGDHLDWLGTLEKRAIEQGSGPTLMCAITAARLYVNELIYEMEFYNGRTSFK